jgi:hypothetical protein
MIILDSFCCAAKDLTHPGLNGWTLFLRLDAHADADRLAFMLESDTRQELYR